MKTLLPALLILLSFQTPATLTVVADLGGESTDALYEAIQSEPETVATSSAPKSFSENDVLPVVSHQLHPGALDARPLSLPGFTPLFLMGNDALSKKWLTEHQATLLSLKATGLVVNVDSGEQLNALRQLAGELTLLPVSGDDLAQRLQLATYPVLITETGLSQ